MHEHRNIPVFKVSGTDFRKFDTLWEGQDKRHTSLYNIFEENDSIYRAYHDQNKNCVNLSVNVKDYDKTLQWLRKILPQFSYAPFVKDRHTVKSVASQKSDKYSQIFTVESSDDGSFDPSTIASVKTKNPWARPPPMELVFDVQDDAQFPPLPKQPTTSPVSHSGNSVHTAITIQDIDTIVANAIAVQERKFADQLHSLQERNNQLESTLKTLTEKIESDMAKMAEAMVTKMMGPTSPFFTKADATQMMNQQSSLQDNTQAQLQLILQLLHKSSDDMEDATVQSPPRKSPRKDAEPGTPTIRNGHDYDDQPMPQAPHGEVGTP